MKALDRVPKATGDQAEFTALAPLAAAGIGVFTVVAGGLATVGGATERVIRNHRGWATAALIGLTLSLALAVASTVSRDTNYVKNNKRLKQWLLNLIAIFLVVGLTGSIGAAIWTATDHSQPNIAVDLKPDTVGMRLEAQAKSSGMRADQHLRIRVFHVEVDSRGNRHYDARNSIYAAEQGPDTSGNVDVKFALPLVARYPFALIQAWVGDPEPACNEALEKQHVVLGCVMVPMPAPDTQPHLALTADGDPATGVLGVKVKQSGVKLTESVSVQVLGTVDGKPNVAIYRAVLTSDGAGNVNESMRVALPKGVTEACVAAKSAVGWADPRCPPDGDKATAWSQILRPRLGSTN